ncbi:hypothetical protein TWF481_005012 [Arthrobotrys musiformis]|uniref:C2H2-type domain-containing protein n=1 Tax=Arthrobotrys musiformis TaxID=47236 RepID=A0AAV9WN25_9PEZI
MSTSNNPWTFGAPLEPRPQQPPAIAPHGYHPVQFCMGLWQNYCPDPYHCPFGAVWVREDHFFQVHCRDSTDGTILYEDEIREASLDFRFAADQVPEETCILPSYAGGLCKTGPHYPRPYEAHLLAPYRRHLQHMVPRFVRRLALRPSLPSAAPAPAPLPLPSPSPSLLPSSSSGGGSTSQTKIVAVGPGKGEKERAVLGPAPDAPVVPAVPALPAAPVALANEALAQQPESQPASQPTNQPASQPVASQPLPPPPQPQPQPAKKRPGGNAGATVSEVDPAAPLVCKWGTCETVFDGQRACLEHIKADHIKSRRSPDYDFTCRIRGCPCGGKVFEKRDNTVSHVTNVGFDIRYAVCCFQPHGCKVALKREWDLPRHRKICKYRPEGYISDEEEEGKLFISAAKRKRGKNDVGAALPTKMQKI